MARGASTCWSPGRGLRNVVVVSLVVLAGHALLACGSGAIEGPDEQADGADDASGRDADASIDVASDETSSDDGSESRGSGNEAGPDDYSWGLPGGDLSLDAVGDVFNTLRAGRCAEAERRLNGFITAGESFPQEQLYRAGIAVCSGDLEQGRTLLQSVTLTVHPGDCRLFKAITSLLERRPVESIQCPNPEETTTTSGSAPTTSGGIADSTGPTSTVGNGGSAPISADASDGD